MSNKKPKYKQIQGDEISIEVALTQAALALDVAGHIAAKEGDSAALVGIADRWMRMCDGLVTPPQEPHKPEPPRPIGFGVADPNQP